MPKPEAPIPEKGGLRRATNFDVLIGGRLREHRLSHRMSQEELARRLGITFQQVQKYERGANRISVSRLKEISEVLEVPIAAWFTEEAPSSGGASQEIGKREPVASARASLLMGSKDVNANEFVSNARTLRLLKSFSQIEDSGARNLVLDLCEKLAARR